MEGETIELLDEDGNKTLFKHITTIAHKGEEFLILAEPSEEESDDTEVAVLRIDRDENGEDCYVPVTDGAAEEEVFAKFLEWAEEDEE